MEEDKWQHVKMDVEEYLESGAELSNGIIEVVKLNLKLGEENPKERKGVVKALKAMLTDKEGTPFHKGNKSDLPAKVRVNVEKLGRMVYEASLQYMAHSKYMLFITPRHKKSGGGFYKSAKEFALANKKRLTTRLKKQYRDKVWDGTLDGLMPLEEE
jgi:hypothetical protein|tara:strand:+ start:749 stop:1219 length:471 start_codon:yes stop_codon:yes gene_type:complete